MFLERFFNDFGSGRYLNLLIELFLKQLYEIVNVPGIRCRDRQKRRLKLRINLINFFQGETLMTIIIHQCKLIDEPCNLRFRFADFFQSWKSLKEVFV